MRWRRLDVPGTDECRLDPGGQGWRLTGVAEFGAPPDAARLRYRVDANAAWETLYAEVEGQVGSRPLHLVVQRSASGDWTVNGRPAPALRGLVDVDLGFTPATNLFPLRRLALRPGESADAAAAWLDDETWRFRPLPQRYERRAVHGYWYESPAAGYAGLLTVTDDGFVREYPGLWRMDG